MTVPPAIEMLPYKVASGFPRCGGRWPKAERGKRPRNRWMYCGRHPPHRWQAMPSPVARPSPVALPRKCRCPMHTTQSPRPSIAATECRRSRRFRHSSFRNCNMASSPMASKSCWPNVTRFRWSMCNYCSTRATPPMPAASSARRPSRWQCSTRARRIWIRSRSRAAPNALAPTSARDQVSIIRQWNWGRSHRT